MTGLALQTVTRTQGNNQALKEGVVSPRTCELAFVEVNPLIDAFRRMVRDLEFDVCEMAITTYLCAKSYGKAFTALPIFLVRDFHHKAIVVNTKSGIRHPKDLEGRKVGVGRGYTVTTGVWARGILESEFDVDLDTVTWVLSGDEHVLEYRPPSNVVAIEPGKSLESMLIEGEIAAAINIEIDHPDIATLIPDAEAAGYEAFRSRGHYPINHLVVVRDDVLDAHPELAEDIFGAFAASKALYVERLARGDIESPTAVDRMHERVLEISGRDPLPYGVDANRVVLEELVGHAVRQGILRGSPILEELFAPGAIGLSG